ncbi:hypothetical protein GCM10023346_04860 [Arthrobacter gyeryongensis]|uniref:Uncharacterized protein n=1 Tax=Arthrobacter gyeryongensis TaxID=1650592 RepID=A0ABP9S201_9MICC
MDEELPEALDAAAVYGGLQLSSFDDVMAGYEACPEQLLRSPGGSANN